MLAVAKTGVGSSARLLFAVIVVAMAFVNFYGFPGQPIVAGISLLLLVSLAAVIVWAHREMMRRIGALIELIGEERLIEPRQETKE